MKQEIEYAVREARSMNLSTEQSIKFIMRSTGCTRSEAKAALFKNQQRVLMSQ